MNDIIELKTWQGDTVAFEDAVIGSGAMKDVCFSPDRSYVIGFFREPQGPAARERLRVICEDYREGIFGQVGGDYWRELFCWPTGVVEHEGRVGVVAPAYAPQFFFEYGSANNDMLGIKGREKEGKWFASANNQARFLDPRERGDWLNYLRICMRIARAVRRMHAAGLAHSDLSYKNVLVDPRSGSACIIDLDGLVVPGKYPPEVVGTPDFIAPEVVMTAHLPHDSPARKLPCIATDRHALAVLIYMYLLYRHPLRGGKVHDPDPSQDETLSMGERALFVEHAHDFSNRIRVADARPSELPWCDTQRMPYTLTGPYLAPLFARAFTDGLRDPRARPSAEDWEFALVRTADLILPCANRGCVQGWFVFDNRRAPSCPFCGTPYPGALPVLNFYSSRHGDSFRPDDQRLMVYTNQSLFEWHVNRHLAPNERLTEAQKVRVGYFVFHQGTWWLVNERLPHCRDLSAGRDIAVGERVALRDGLQLLLSRESGGRLALVQMAGGG
ncbi:lipopolysaccharide kinase InaA family protein [uncultured Thiodictyon sp.]|uniref:helix-hairpin-helix domain-containing protein n=1 Tax=uncultured Thiodictyon sp. TaxID=1846217 RepID=UPI0025D0267C|nr:lipopolysaccharide kinase InaA family protein [uncultured Thiodictyon sp.]